MFDQFRPLIRNRSFVHLWISQILSQFTIHIINFLMLISLYEWTGSALATSLLWVVYALPAVLIGPIAAASVDMTDRRSVLVVVNLLQGIVIFVFAFIFPTPIYFLYLAAFSYSLLNQFYVPAEFAAVSQLVPKKQYPQANSLFFLTQQASVVIGYSVAGLLLVIFGFKSSLFLGSVFLFLAFVSVLFLPKLKTKDKVSGNFSEIVKKFYSEIAEGYRFIKDNRNVRFSFLLLLGLQVALAITLVSFPKISDELLGLSTKMVGVMMAAPAGIGAAIGAVVVSRMLGTKKWRKKRSIEISFFTMSLGIFVLIFLVPAIDAPLRYVVSFLTVLEMGYSFVGILIPIQTYLQEATPGGMRGRLYGNFWFVVTVATIIPVLFSGAISEFFGIKLLLGLMGIAGIVFSYLVHSRGDRLISNGFRAK